MPHDVGTTAVGPHRQAAADDLTESGQIGHDVEASLRTGIGKTETGNDFVEDQKRTVLRAQFTQATQETGLRQHKPHIARHRLHKQRCNLIGPGFEQRLHSPQIVVGSKQRIRHRTRRNTGRTGNGERSHTGTGAGQEGIAMSMIAADELDHLVASGHAAGKTQRTHGGFGTGVHHAHHFHGGQRGTDFLGKTHFIFAGRAVACAARRSLAYGFRYGRVRMAHQHGAPGTEEIDDVLTIGRGKMRTFGIGNEQRIGMDIAAGPHGAVHTAGNKLLSMGEKVMGTLGIHVLLLLL